MNDIVIVAYRPKSGQAAALRALLERHVPELRALGLATDMPATVMRAADGTLIEVFEWRDGGVEAAHGHPDVHRMWAEFSAACDYVRLADLPETAELFATFAPLAAAPA